MHPLLLSLALLTPAQATPKADDNDVGVLPLGADGKPLNLDFETGTLKDWTAEGTAFRDQPIKGDTVNPRRGDMRSRHQGQYWIGGYEKFGDKPTGTLTSAPFKVTHPWASFLVGGGPWPETCVELVLLPRNEVFFRASGLEEEDMRRVVVDLSKHQGKEIQVRLVDRHTGHWGHVNFDDFRLHAKKPSFPERPQKEAPPKADEYKFNGLPPEKAAAAMTVPEGFTVTLFAGEPDVHQPVAMCLDDRGRVWVVEAFTYPRRHAFPGPVLPADQKARGDRILIFEDTDGDGKFDKKTVFFEGLNLVSGIEVGFGGVWVGAAPYLLFIPHDEKTDAAGEPKILLDGWGYQDTHETLNTFIWGPDGWLYGCHGVFTHSRVGKPGTPDKDRVPINAGVWRYHPTRHVFEVFAHGTSNPWGLDYNDYGEFFVEACVIPHCFHIIQGARYNRQAGPHFNPYTYADIPTIADHRHYVGANPHGGNNRSDSAGGGHAHCGLMCYLGGAWPKEYRGQLFMGNIHGRRINMDVLKPKGSGYVAGHGPDFLLANDGWARFINMRYGPDGNVYVIDWYDKQACHTNQPEIWDRTNGRVYKVSYRGTKPVTGIDLKKCSDEELVKYQLHENDWYVRHARRVLQERASRGQIKEKKKVADELVKMLADHADPTRRLRALWVLHVTRLPLTGFQPHHATSDKDEHVRAWGILLVAEGNDDEITALNFFPYGTYEHAAKDNSPVVRRSAVHALRRIAAADRWPLLEKLLSHPEDADDPNLPYLYWYAMEPLAEVDAARALKLAADAKVPQLLPLMARRVGAIGTPEAIGQLIAVAASASDASQQLAYLRGISDGLKGKRQFPMPKEWPDASVKLAASSSVDVRGQAQALAVVFGDKTAFAALRNVLADPKAATAARQAALTSLVDARDAELVPVLHALVSEPALRGAALRGLAAFDDPKTPGVILGAYGSFTLAEKRDALATLAARPASAKALMAAVAAKTVPASDVSAETVRQLRNLGDKELDRSIAELWGVVRDTPADRAKLIAEWKKKLTAPSKAPPPDTGRGRAVFARTCQQCHTLYGVGGKVGPDITGSNRANLDYLLENIFDPSAVIPKEYAATVLNLADGRTVTGIIKEETKTALTVMTDRETLTIPVGDVERRKPSELSMMPDDILKQVNETELRALVAYLQNPSQVPMLATPENAKDFFNGKDLAGWDGDKDVWSVENGEIVGKTAKGLKKNTFLKSHLAAEDFKLSLKVKLVPNKENSGIQFRSEPLPDGEMRGPQADIGQGWWGKLYEESGRGLLVKEGGEKFVKVDDWNEYVVEAKGSRVKAWINGNLVFDYDDPKLSRRGVFGLQVHSGGPMEVRFKDLKLEVLK
jgi:putative membrane-bound dehydrogenase-like protein